MPSSPLLLQERRTSYSITFIHLHLLLLLLLFHPSFEISHDKLRHRCCAWAALLHPLQLLQYCSCGIFHFKASFYDFYSEICFSPLACYLIHIISSCFFQMPNCCILHHSHILGCFLLPLPRAKQFNQILKRKLFSFCVCAFVNHCLCCFNSLFLSGFLVVVVTVMSPSPDFSFSPFFLLLLQSNKSHIWRTSRRFHTYTQKQNHTPTAFSLSRSEQVRVRLIVPTVLAS